METFLKKPVTIVAVESVYTNTETEIVPAYALVADTGDKLVIDATTGLVVR